MSARILIIEDDPGLRDLVATVLDEAGFVVQLAENGAVGLDALDVFLPQVIILDRMMPVLNGDEFAEAYAARSGPKVPIIAFTASREVAEWATSIGAAAFVGKPFDLDQLTAATRFCLTQPS